MKRETPEERLARLRVLSRLLDSAWLIPGTNIRVGLDALVGLVPGIGDLVGLLLAAYILFESAIMGAPGSLLFRMFFNVMVDTLSGTIPLAGDVVDVFWKANVRNVALLEQHVTEPHVARRANRRFVLVVLLVSFAFIAAFAFLLAALFILFVRLIGV